MVIGKESEWKYGHMVWNNMQKCIFINSMDATKLNSQVEIVIGENARIIKWKDMQLLSGLMEKDSSDNTWMIAYTGMEYIDGLMGQYIKESINRIIKMGKDITGGPMAINIGENTKMAWNMEKESNKRTEYCTE
jgi:hypothetical protein